MSDKEIVLMNGKAKLTHDISLISIVQSIQKLKATCTVLSDTVSGDKQKPIRDVRERYQRDTQITLDKDYTAPPSLRLTSLKSSQFDIGMFLHRDERNQDKAVYESEVALKHSNSFNLQKRDDFQTQNTFFSPVGINRPVVDEEDPKPTELHQIQAILKQYDLSS